MLLLAGSGYLKACVECITPDVIVCSPETETNCILSVISLIVTAHCSTCTCMWHGILYMYMHVAWHALHVHACGMACSTCTCMWHGMLYMYLHACDLMWPWRAYHWGDSLATPPVSSCSQTSSIWCVSGVGVVRCGHTP